MLFIEQLGIFKKKCLSIASEQVPFKQTQRRLEIIYL